MGPIGEAIARKAGTHLKHGHPKPTFDRVKMALDVMRTNGSTANATITIDYIPSKGKWIAALQDKEMISGCIARDSCYHGDIKQNGLLIHRQNMCHGVQQTGLWVFHF